MTYTVSTLFAGAAGGPKTPLFDSTGRYIKYCSGVTGRISRYDTQTSTNVNNHYGTGTAGNTNGGPGVGQVNAPALIGTDDTYDYWYETGIIRRANIATQVIEDFVGNRTTTTATDGTGIGAASTALITGGGFVMNNAKTMIHNVVGTSLRTIRLSDGLVTTLSIVLPGVGSVAISNDDSHLFSNFTSRLWRTSTDRPAFATYFAGSGDSLNTLDGQGRQCSFRSMGFSCVDGNTLFIPDNVAHVIRAVTVNVNNDVPTMSTVAGTPGTTGTTEGDGSVALFNGPNGITKWPGQVGKYVITDSSNGKLRLLTAS